VYFAPAFFFYLLGKSFQKNSLYHSILHIVKLGIAVIVTFAICWAPFLSIDQITQVIQRLFPFARGLYEDKVSNLWCSISPLIKVNEFLSREAIVRLCIGVTFIGFIPTCVRSLFRPTPKIFLYSLLCCSFSFFMFSYQVHEKSVLLPLLPASLLILDHPELVSWLISVATFSMFPLMYKDRLSRPYWCLQILFIYCINNMKLQYKPAYYFMKMGSYILIIFLHMAKAFVKPPARYPDIITLMISAFSFAHFISITVYVGYLQFTTKEKN